MRKHLATLFNCQISAQHDVAAIEESAQSHITSVLKAARGLIAKNGGKATHVFETDLGFIVATPTVAMMLSDDGTVLTKPLPDVAEGALSGAIASLAIQIKSALLDKDYEKAKTLTDRIVAASKAESGKKVAVKEATMGDLSAMVNRLLPEDEAKRQLAVMKDLIRGRKKAEGLSESQIDEMILGNNSPYVDSSLIDIGDIKCSVYGPGMRLRTEDFIKEAPNYSIADFVIEAALKEVLAGKVGESMVVALKAQLKGSSKVDALEISLAESSP